MDVFTNTKKFKKIFIILIFLILFNFACPKNVRAASIVNSGLIIVEQLFFGIFDGIQGIIDKYFIDESLRDSNTTSAENVIKGKFLLMEPNIFKRITERESYLDYTDVNSERNKLRETILGWYYALRNLAIVALLSILVYVAIRMILSTVSQDKAKYKMMFKDWLVALCLLFFMHYIMVGILNLSSTITEAIGTSGQSYSSELSKEILANIEKATQLNGDSPLFKEDTGDTVIRTAIKEAMNRTVIYAAMVIMNIIFICKYVIRSLTIMFLTLLAPITCITYPIDKISDGKAQAYDMWFKEFLYQVIIQPFHLLLYVVLIGSSAQLAGNNLIYAMLCFGIMIPAEKFVKQMFGFKDKLGSPLGAFAGGAVASQLMNSFKSSGKAAGSSGDSGDRNKNSSKEDDIPPNTKDLELPVGNEGESENANVGSWAGEQNNNRLGEQQQISAPEDSSQTVEQGDNVEDGPENEDNSSENSGIESEENSNELIEEDPNNNIESESGENQNIISDDKENDVITNGEEDQNANGEEDQNANGEADSNANGKADSNANGERQLQTSSNPEKPSMVNRAISGIKKGYGTTKNIVSGKVGRHFMRKYGTTKVGGVAGGITKNVLKKGVSSAYRGAKNAGRKTIKGAATLAGSLALGAFGAMFGKGKEGMAAGATLGRKIGGGVTKVTDKAWEKVEKGAGTVKDTASDVYNEFGDHKEEKNKKEHHMDESNIKQARINFKNRFGREASPAELKKELDNMYMMQSYGIDKSNYNSVLKQAEMYQEETGVSEDYAMRLAMSSALQAQQYSAKDMKDEKTMNGATRELLRTI